MLQSLIRHELDSQEQKQDAGGDISAVTAGGGDGTGGAAGTRTSCNEQDSKAVGHQVREVRGSTTTTPAAETGESGDAQMDEDEDEDEDEIEPAPSYFDAVFARSRTASGAGDEVEGREGGAGR